MSFEVCPIPTLIGDTISIPVSQVHLLTTVRDAQMFGWFCLACGICIGLMVGYGYARRKYGI